VPFPELIQLEVPDITQTKAFAFPGKFPKTKILKQTSTRSLGLQEADME
jgi:hypothetical protein